MATEDGGRLVVGPRRIALRLGAGSLNRRTIGLLVPSPERGFAHKVRQFRILYGLVHRT